MSAGQQTGRRLYTVWMFRDGAWTTCGTWVDRDEADDWVAWSRYHRRPAEYRIEEVVR